MGVDLTSVALVVVLMQGVYCQTWNVFLPQRIMGVAGPCLTIPCGFSIPESYEPELQVNCSAGAIWRRGKHYGPDVLSERNPKLNKLQGSMDGDLRKKNCTTTLHSLPKNYSQVLFFRLECLGELKYSFTKGVTIISQSEIPPPQLSQAQPVQEGDIVTLRCSVPVPCPAKPPSLTWLPRDSTSQEKTRVEQTDGQMMMTSTLTFIASADQHSRGVSCSVSYPLTEGGSTEPSAATQRISVLYAPRSTGVTLSTSGPVAEGTSVALTCSSESNPPVSLYTWYRADSGQPIKRAKGQTLILRVRHNDSGLYLCEAQNVRGSHRSTPVSLQVISSTGSREFSALVIPYIVCGIMFALFILIVAVGVCKYQSLSRRLKQVELKEETAYTTLQISSITSDYDQIQPQKPKSKISPDLTNYENIEEMKISKASTSQSRSKALG
ncbi:myelin-associated glycoprotein isoform X2 [Cheilinus undulatus]|uniref:myelin-associated glycoprotein isoform X2 n=1 Tax=Cheilinus undulatus TaxID=241271 RepID=UPI001BD6277C|nr:myelin-associated glycoprotein isoform X2 [Cheilinus undulatus]